MQQVLRLLGAADRVSPGSPPRVTSVALAGLSQALVTRVSAKLVMALGMAMIGGGILWATQVPVHGHFWSDLAGPFFVAGAGTAFAFIPVSIGGLAGVAEHEAGLASGLLNTSQQLGGAIGVAIASTVATSPLHDARSTTGGAGTGRAHRRLPVGVLGLRRDRASRALPLTFLLVRRRRADESRRSRSHLRLVTGSHSGCLRRRRPLGSSDVPQPRNSRRSDGRIMVRYKVKPDQAAKNEELVRAVYDALQRTNP